MTLRGGLALLCAVTLFTGCWSGCGDRPLPDPEPKSTPSDQDLIAFHRERARQLDSLIAATASTWGPAVKTTGTGLRVQKLDSLPGAPRIDALTPGTILELRHRFSLLDGRTISDWPTDGPLAFELGNTDLPAGFHELIGDAHLGDSLRALIPPSRAWGMSGLPPDIPQEAVIRVEVRIRQYRRPS